MFEYAWVKQEESSMICALCDMWIVCSYQWFSSLVPVRTARGAAKNSRHPNTTLQNSNSVDPGWIPGITNVNLTCIWWLRIRWSEKVTLKDTGVCRIVFYTHIELEVITMSNVYSDMATNLPRGSKKFSSMESSRVSVWLILIFAPFSKPYLKSFPCVSLIY